MKKFACPSCGAEIVFQSASSVFTVCRSCRSTLVRHDLDLEKLGKMAELKTDASPFQIGTAGIFEKAGFELIGRVQVSWAQGNWNEWFARFDSGREGWLAEAQGFLMMSFSVPARSIKSVPNLGEAVTLGTVTYTVDDIKSVTYTFAEGELPFPAPKGFTGTSVDLSYGEADFASLSFGAADDSVDAFVGRYVEFADLKFKNLKELDGW